MAEQRTLDAERADFEAFAISQGWDTGRNKAGEYYSSSMDRSWSVWQAARRSPVADAAGELPESRQVCKMIRGDVGPEDFGIPSEYAAMARNYANFQLARQSAPEGAPVGMVLVPVEPTEAMVHAAEDLPAPRMFGKVYRAMIAAAPTSASAKPADQPAPGPWQVLGMEDMPDADRKLDVILTNGVLEQNRDHSQIDWTQVADWRYAADQNKMENNDE